MLPTSPGYVLSRTPRLLLTLASVASQHVPSLASYIPTSLSTAPIERGNITGFDLHTFARRDDGHGTVVKVVLGCLIPVLVLASGLFAGLTLGYMSLDETQLNVLSISGTPQQKIYANKIKPIRKDGHLLLVTLLLANMIVNESLPVISDSVLGSGPLSVVISTVLIVIFAEIIPQSLATRYGLYFGAKMAGLVRVLIWTLGIVAWPAAKLLEFVLGPHHGIIYRRAELKELIAMHSSVGEYGGDLKTDTVTIIGGALDLQEKVVKQAMTPIDQVFMLSIDAKLDYETLRRICLTGHSRIPVYEEVEVPVASLAAIGAMDPKELSPKTADAEIPSIQDNKEVSSPQTQKVKKIIGVFLVKQCVLLDPNDATPVRKIPLNKVPFVPNNEPLLGILDKFQEGRSHMAIVSRYSVERAVSVKKAVKRGLTQRLRDRVGMGDSDSSSSSDSEDEEVDRSPKRHKKKRSKKGEDTESDNETTLKEGSEKEEDGGSAEHTGKHAHFRLGHRGRSKKRPADLEMGVVKTVEEPAAKPRTSLTLPRALFGRFEQSMPADAVLTKAGADEFLQGVDPAVMPLGIITLEDVLEELIGEEIYDEFDPQGHPDMKSYAQSEAKGAPSLKRRGSAPQLTDHVTFTNLNAIQAIVQTPKPTSATPLLRPMAMPGLRSLGLNRLNFTRSRSAPPTPRDKIDNDVDPMEKLDLTPSTVPEGVVVPSIATVVLPSSNQDHELFLTDTHQETLPVFSASEPAVPGAAAIKGKPTHHVLFSAPIRAPVPVPATTASSAPSTSLLYPDLSHGTSPSPSFEQAILVERKRRAASGTSSSPAPKGGRFKSSPLTGERSGVVVAESVRRDTLVEGEAVVKAGDGRI